MPALVEPGSPVGAVSALVDAAPGYLVEVSVPYGTDTAGTPPGGAVAGWVLVADETAPGGARVEPVFLAGGRAWTPDQYRGAYGQGFTMAVVRG